MPPAEQESLPRQDAIQYIEYLTQQALEASRAGDWDRVSAYYASRGISLHTTVLSRAVAQQLLEVDAQIRAAALVAQAAISSLLADNARVKLQLRRLRESAGPLSSTGAMHREV